MKLGIMQPYFFPYLGYFQLISACDQFILLDEVQYIRHGWINRNRVLKPVQGVQYIIVPIEKHHREALIKDIIPHRSEPWREKILGQLRHYEKRAPFYEQTIRLVEDSIAPSFRNITELNLNCMRNVLQYAGVPFDYSVSSNRDFNYKNVADAGGWALRISEQMNASCYINPVSGAALFDPEKFRASGIALKFAIACLPQYDQKRSEFSNALSILDVLMFHSPEQVNRLLHSGRLTSNPADQAE